MGGFPVPPNSHSAGSLSSVSPRILDRVGHAIPSWNSGGKVHRTGDGNPMAARPSALKAMFNVTDGFTFTPLGATGHGRADVIAGATRRSQRCACPAS